MNITNKIGFVPTAVCAIGALCSLSATAATVTLGDAEDTWGAQNAGTTNYGADETFQVGSGGANQIRLGYAAFDVSSLDGLYTTIDSVTLRVYVTGSQANTLVMSYAAMADTNALWSESTATYNHQIQSALTAWDVGPSWQAPETYADELTGGQTVSMGSGVTGWFDMDITAAGGLTDAGAPASLTALIDLWITQETTDGVNAGIALWKNHGGGYTRTIASSENATVAFRPELVVTYTAVPEPSSAALLGLGGIALILRRRK